MLLEVLHSILQLLTSVANSRNQLVLKGDLLWTRLKLRYLLGTDKAPNLVFLYKFLKQ